MDEAHHLYQINRTIVSIMATRGYKVPKSVLDMSFEDWKAVPEHGDKPQRDKLTQLYKKPDESDCIMVFFDNARDGKVGVPQIQE